MWGLDVADYLAIAEEVLDVDAKRLATVTDLGAAESALAAPFAGWGDRDFYPEPHEKAAILCSRLIRNHPLRLDGNKRIAYVCMRTFLAVNGYGWRRPDPAEVELVINQLAAREISEEEFAAWVGDNVERPA